jgi:hypothetical protein
MENFNTNENFWEVHPALAAAGPFKEIHRKDKSRGKDRSSKLAWCVKLIWNRKSDFYNLPEVGPDNKIDLVFEDVYGDSKYYKSNKVAVEELRAFYISSTTTAAARTLLGIEDKLKERDVFMRNTPYDMGQLEERGWIGGTVDTLDKMMANTEKLYNLYNKARQVVEQEEQTVAMGGGQESLSDTGDI